MEKNYSKALKKAGDASAVETQVTTDGVEKYSYARVLLPEQEEQLKKIDKGDTNKAGPRTPAVDDSLVEGFEEIRAGARGQPQRWATTGDSFADKSPADPGGAQLSAAGRGEYAGQRKSTSLT